jgi:hypothetical protein
LIDVEETKEAIGDWHYWTARGSILKVPEAPQP